MAMMTYDDLKAMAVKQDNPAAAQYIKVGMSSCGIAAGAVAVFEYFKREVAARCPGIAVRQCGCNGQCHAEPIVEVCASGLPPVLYGHVNLEIAERIVDEHLGEGRPLKGLTLPDVPGQVRIVMRNCGVIDPESIDDYMAVGGYQGLGRGLCDLAPDQVIDEIKKSGLRGRGGAGYPAYLKWTLARKAFGDEKYVICNGDEGDPGAYMDRSILEGDPHSVIEGMLTIGYAIGASKGFFYIRAEYPLAIKRIQMAMDQAYERGLLGTNILGSPFSFDCEVRLGAGAFVCGEETALIASIEGKRGTPRAPPPHPPP
jgi:NADH-quinone oxidoreductase subunit F